MRPSIDYSDDEDEYNGSDSDPECDDPAMKAINSMLSKDSWPFVRALEHDGHV